MTHDVLIAEVVEAESALPPVQTHPAAMPSPSWPTPFRTLQHIFDWLFGMACIVVGVAFVSTIPLLQFVALGYLLEVSGRVARTGRLRSGFIHVLLAGRIGGLILGTWLTLLIPNLVSSFRYDAELIDPSSSVTFAWGIGRIIVDGLAAVHVVSAWSCGGRLRHFFWPLWLVPLAGIVIVRAILRRTTGRWLVSQQVRWRILRGEFILPSFEQWFPPVRILRELLAGSFYTRVRDAVWDLLVIELQPLHFFWLGVQGFIGAIIWLALPVLLMMAGTQNPGGGGTLSGWVGGLMLTHVVLYLPFLQTHFAAEQRFGCFFEVGRVRAMFRRAPIAFLFALMFTLALPLPLYLLKVELTPSEVSWLPSTVFVAFMLPAKFLIGWAVGRSYGHAAERFFLFRWIARVLTLPVAAAYVIVVFFAQYFTWDGVYGLIKQHAFLLPTPFAG